MASPAALVNPISETSFIQSKLTAQSLNSSSVSKHLLFARYGSSYSQLRTLRCSYAQSNAVKSSSHTPLSPETESRQITEVPLLSCSEAIERLRAFRTSYESKQRYPAMYSSIYGGITTDLAAMVIPMDDHMVHRGHGVFDTTAIVDGHLYELDQHIDRILGSAEKVKIKPPFDRETIRRILIQTVSASKCREGSLRYWLSAGPGDFQLSSSGCPQSSLYAIVIEDNYDRRAIKVITSSVPIKPQEFAVTKNVDYLPNVLSKMEAEENDANVGIWLDEDGYVAEGPSMNVAFVTKEKDLLMPRFDKILTGCTAKRVLVLAESLVEKGIIRGIRQDNVTVEEGKNADEMMLVGSGIVIRPVVQWDDQVIGDGKEGSVTQCLLNLILEDMKAGPATVRVPVPY